MNIELTLQEFPLRLYDKDGNKIYFNNGEGYCIERKYVDGKQVYFKDTTGYEVGTDPDKVTELTLEDIAEKFKIDINKLKIKK